MPRLLPILALPLLLDVVISASGKIRDAASSRGQITGLLAKISHPIDGAAERRCQQLECQLLSAGRPQGYTGPDTTRSPSPATERRSGLTCGPERDRGCTCELFQHGSSAGTVRQRGKEVVPSEI